MSHSPATLDHAENRSQFRRRLVTYLITAAFIALLAGGGFAAFESRQVSNYWEGLWWALSLMSTVGFIGEAPESAWAGWCRRCSWSRVSR